MSTPQSGEVVVGAPPRLYPEEIWVWYNCYAALDAGKLAHDVLLYLAEAGLKHLATIASSVAFSTGELEVNRGFRGLDANRMTFGDWVQLLEDCHGAVPGWEFDSLKGKLEHSGRFAAAASVIAKTLSQSRSMSPVNAALTGQGKPGITWWGALKALVAYRNSTLGHPDASIVTMSGFYDEMTGPVAAAVAELLWNEVTMSAFERYRIGSFTRREEKLNYRATARDNMGVTRPLHLCGREGGDFAQAESLILEYTDGTFAYRAKHVALSRILKLQSKAPEPAPTSPEDSEGHGDGERPDDMVRVGEEDEVDEPVSAAVQDLALLEANGTALVDGDRPDHFRKGQLVQHRKTPFTTQVEVQGEPFTYLDSRGNGHLIDISHRFSMGSYLVTQELYEEVAGEHRSRDRGASLPVSAVTWLEATAFCNELSKQAGLPLVYEISGDEVRVSPGVPGYRLPMEDEWTFACTNGASAASAWTSKDAKPDGLTRPVDKGVADDLGFHDLLGNVWEWCNDIYRTDYPVTPGAWLIEPDPRSDRVIRGGSYKDRLSVLGPALRFRHVPNSWRPDLGLRIARTIE